MSRLIGSPFHKPTPFEFPRAPPSPPDTNADTTGPAHLQTSSSLLGGHEPRSGEPETSPAYSAPTPESAGSRFRKTSSIAYHTSGIRESREKISQRGSKAFVIVIPPAAFTQDHGQLGHTLSSGPRHRLSHGILMPLFPTMYGQLAAIAREYNFPSTTGLCLYPHFMENGVTMTPRISDDAWPFIWSHVFEVSPSPRSPISGKIDFDIDVRQARWYASWMASSHRDHLDHPFSANPSIAASVAHERGDSRTTFHEVEDPYESRVVAPATRHVPRKLSLVDRYDLMSSRSGSRPASRSALSPPEHAQVASQVLSPIFQEEEPKSARNALDSRVKSWRASAVLQPTPLAATGQTSLEPANMPNMLPIEDSLLDTPQDELNLADFTWSISSAGPSDHDPISPMPCDQVSSVQIASRIEGSVCLTPSDCTSFGPSDYTLPSPGPSVYRLPSPDIAHRMYEDMPLTPSTATSWGAPLEFPSSPFGFYRAPSVDLGERLLASRPVTPSTATSWGPASGPSSPLDSEYAPHSTHLADRGDCSRPVTPSTATSWGAPSSYPPSPTTSFRVHTPDAGHRGFEDSDLQRGWKHTPGRHSWPYVGSSTSGQNLPVASEAQTHVPWPHSWPYTTDSSHLPHASTKLLCQDDVGPWALSWPHHASGDTSSESADSPPIRSPSMYPRLVIYQPVYPHFDLYPAVVLAKKDLSEYPSFNLYSVLPLYASTRVSTELQPVVIKLQACYPAFDLYPAIYPENVYQIYPPVAVNDRSAVPTHVAPRYPAFDLYPAVYPHVAPYPLALGTYRLDKKPTQKTQGYHDFDPAIAGETRITGGDRCSEYPNFNLCPPAERFERLGKNTADALRSISVTANSRYPYFDLYPAVYPYIDPYPALDGGDHVVSEPRSSAGYPYFVLYPPAPVKPVKPNPTSVKLAAYPVFDLYPAVYPAFNVYPLVEEAPVVDKIATRSGYPYLELYPAGPSEDPERLAHKPLSIRTPCSYPIFDLYPAVYPFIRIYPALACASYTTGPMTPGFPDFDLYPLSASNVETPVNLATYVEYPTFKFYPQLAGKMSEDKQGEEARAINVKVEARYPAFDLYPAVYPYFDLWPAVDQPRMVSQLSKPSSRSTHSRLTHSELHAMVMMERIGSTGSFGSFQASSHLPSKLVKSHDDLHHAVFPGDVVVTPSGTSGRRYPEVGLRNTSLSDELLARRRLSTLRPSSTRLTPPAAPSPTRRLPQPPPSHRARLSSAFESIPTLDFEKDLSPMRVSPTRRGLKSRLPQDVESHQVPGLNRASSWNKSSSLLSGVSDKPSRSKSLSAVTKSPAPSSRDSVVSHSMRAYNNSSQDGVQLSMKALSKFPAPPVPRLPVPNTLDTSKHPFTR